eukprot:CAMPEP_0170639054 /NCGR_PEP_ID=MMETSP0224-20130122/39418_1 /TAXON_ID=285029 /ORGANISM="Togula jolla, Strain CCCM 725" /LENGTH=456 /DNA_ID=CAMNT_0010969331 /DNA_START=88 /DNA_END=1458 /DNA_ORIENTATION=+
MASVSEEDLAAPLRNQLALLENELKQAKAAQAVNVSEHGEVKLGPSDSRAAEDKYLHALKMARDHLAVHVGTEFRRHRATLRSEVEERCGQQERALCVAVAGLQADLDALRHQQELRFGAVEEVLSEAILRQQQQTEEQQQQKQQNPSRAAPISASVAVERDELRLRNTAMESEVSGLKRDLEKLRSKQELQAAALEASITELRAEKAKVQEVIRAGEERQFGDGLLDSATTQEKLTRSTSIHNDGGKTPVGAPGSSTRIGDDMAKSAQFSPSPGPREAEAVLLEEGTTARRSASRNRSKDYTNARTDSGLGGALSEEASFDLMTNSASGTTPTSATVAASEAAFLRACLEATMAASRPPGQTAPGATLSSMSSTAPTGTLGSSNALGSSVPSSSPSTASGTEPTLRSFRGASLGPNRSEGMMSGLKGPTPSHSVQASPMQSLRGIASPVMQYRSP